jgi:hypothetical protein
MVASQKEIAPTVDGANPSTPEYWFTVFQQFPLEALE